MTGTTWVEESGLLSGPVMVTNTHSVGVVRDAVVAWMARQRKDTQNWWALPVVAETYDGLLNDINGFHVKPRHAFEALDSARSGPVPEGNVGGGTGMTCHEFKGGIGTASRRLSDRDGGYTVGVLAQCNYGLRDQLRVAGLPVGQELRDDLLVSRSFQENGSIIIVVATDAPLLPHQLKRVARRVTMGLARNGSVAGNGSGDLFIAFSTANPEAGRAEGIASLTMFPNDRMSPLFEATVQATEECIINALVAAETLAGINGIKAVALPHGRLRDILRRHNRLAVGRVHGAA
jgi:L-aminopeptidase/D-esterase-like protein